MITLKQAIKKYYKSKKSKNTLHDTDKCPLLSFFIDRREVIYIALRINETATSYYITHEIYNSYVTNAKNNTSLIKSIKKLLATKFDDIRICTKADLSNTELYEVMREHSCDIFRDTTDFQVKYGLIDDKKEPHFIEKSQIDMKIGHLKEELEEIEKAHERGDLVEFADGIMDLIYVAAGLASLCKLPSQALWNDVQNSNMIGKERVTSLDEATKRNSTFDVRKTKEWVAPRGNDIINEASFEASASFSDRLNHHIKSNDGAISIGNLNTLIDKIKNKTLRGYVAHQ